MLFELPDWCDLLKNLYACLRMQKRNKALRRSYYRKIQKEKLRLAELGINQNKILIACRFLSSVSCVRSYRCDACVRMANEILEPDIQLSLKLK